MLPLLSFDVPGCVAGESDIGLPNCLSLLRLIRSIEADRWLWVWCQALMDVTLLVHGGRVSVREHHILSHYVSSSSTTATRPDFEVQKGVSSEHTMLRPQIIRNPLWPIRSQRGLSVASSALGSISYF